MKENKNGTCSTHFSGEATDNIFSLVMASAVHDMKNSIGHVLGQLDRLHDVLSCTPEHRQLATTLHYETTRINNSLMQLLALYKLDTNQLKLRPVQVELQDFVEDCAAAVQPVARQRGVEIETDTDDEVMGLFDPDLVGIAVQNVLANSLRYAAKKVRFTAWRASTAHPCTIIQVEDDGAGYPDAMLSDPGNFIRRINKSTGSTGLGLYFAGTVANLHQRQGQHGTITLDNESRLGGGRFQIRLP